MSFMRNFAQQSQRDKKDVMPTVSGNRCLRRSPERYGSPQWQIEALRRLEIPDDMQKKYGFAPLGDANSAVKQQIFAGNATRFYKIKLKAADNTKMPAFSEDRLAALKNQYAQAANEPSNLRYGYVRAA